MFADDSTVFKGGRSLPTLIKSVQRAIDVIAECADTWGFKISTGNTVAVLFAPREYAVDLTSDPSRRGFKSREVGEISRSRLR
jgi:hypothetical protein